MMTSSLLLSQRFPIARSLRKTLCNEVLCQSDPVDIKTMRLRDKTNVIAIVLSSYTFLMTACYHLVSDTLFIVTARAVRRRMFSRHNFLLLVIFSANLICLSQNADTSWNEFQTTKNPKYSSYTHFRVFKTNNNSDLLHAQEA